jgi:hypothetical protein
VAVVWAAQAALYASVHRYWFAAVYAMLSVFWTGQFFGVRRRRHAIAAAGHAWASGGAAEEVPAKILARYTRLSPIHDRLSGRPFWQVWIGAGTNGVVTVDGTSLTWRPRYVWTRLPMTLTIDHSRVSDCRRNGNDVVVRVNGNGQVVFRSQAAILIEAWATGVPMSTDAGGTVDV